MKNLRYLCVTLIPLLLIACSDIQVTQPGKSLHDTITVTGEASVSRVPDRFALRAVSSRTGDDIGAMKEQLDGDIRAAMQLATDLGIEKKQIQAASLNVQPEWQWQPTRKLIGYRVSRPLTLYSDSLETHANMLEGLARIGFTEIQPMGSSLADPDSAEQEILALAVEKARQRASVLARAAGRELGEALIIEDQGSHSPSPMPMLAARAEGSDSAWSAGEIQLNGRVSITWRLR